MPTGTEMNNTKWIAADSPIPFVMIVLVGLATNGFFGGNSPTINALLLAAAIGAGAGASSLISDAGGVRALAASGAGCIPIFAAALSAVVASGISGWELGELIYGIEWVQSQLAQAIDSRFGT